MGNPLANDLNNLRKEVESTAHPGKYLQRFHVVPPVGWLNDPNGLCQLGSTYHAYFQYSPFNAQGGVKMWGHYTSDDLVTWTYRGAALFPDQPFDVSGVYSGCAFVEYGVMHVFYTGNVKLEDNYGYDYIQHGREANQIHTMSLDGYDFGPKQVVLGNKDYPEDVSNHVRDPKVWRQGDSYYMVLGARTKADRGEVLVYRSRDLDTWELANTVTTDEPFGYMWECPDYFELRDRVALERGERATTKVLSVSPQGLAGGDWDRRNVYQSGYFVVKGDLLGSPDLQPFALWDAGFDFYAPQTFQANDGRRILVGWMGMPDEKTYENPTVREGWQHCFTIPREVTVRDGRVLQRPVRELENYRTHGHFAKERLSYEGLRTFDMAVEDIDSRPFTALLAGELRLSWDGRRFGMEFTNKDKSGVGAGRDTRFEVLDELRDVRVVGDESSIEVFVNDGELAFSTRYYPETYGLEVDAPGSTIFVWDIDAPGTKFEG